MAQQWNLSGMGLGPAWDDPAPPPPSERAPQTDWDFSGMGLDDDLRQPGAPREPAPFQPEPYDFPETPHLPAPGTQQLLEPELPEERTYEDPADYPDISKKWWEWGTDLALAASKGVIAVGESVVGLLDIPTLGYAGKFLEESPLPWLPEEAKEILTGFQSLVSRRAQEQVGQATGIRDTLEAVWDNPEYVAELVGESLPLMLAGGGWSRLLPKGLSALTRGAAGEGIVGSGMAAQQFRQASETGRITPKQAGLAVTTGAVTGVVTKLSGHFAKRLGIADFETMMAGASTPKAKAGLAKAFVGGMITEGAFEELPQSIQEQIQANYALGRPFMEGVKPAAVLGFITGAAIGGPVAARGAITGRKGPPSREDADKALTEVTEDVKAITEAKAAEKPAEKPPPEEPPAAPPPADVAPEPTETLTEAQEQEFKEAFEAALAEEKAAPTPEAELPPLQEAVSREVLQAAHEAKKVAAAVSKAEPLTPAAAEEQGAIPLTGKRIQEEGPKKAAIKRTVKKVVAGIAPSEPRISAEERREMGATFSDAELKAQGFNEQDIQAIRGLEGTAEYQTARAAGSAARAATKNAARARALAAKKPKLKRPPTVKLADVTEPELAQLRQILERDEKPPKTYGTTREQYRAAITTFLKSGKPTPGSNVAVQVVRQAPTQDFAADLAVQKQAEPLEEREPPAPAIPLKRGDVENMLERAWNKAIKPEGIEPGDPTTWREWVAAVDSDSVAMVIENDFDIYQMFLQQLPEELTALDVVEAYKRGTLVQGLTRVGVRTPPVAIEDVPVEPTGAIGEPVATPILSSPALKTLWGVARARVTDRTRDRVIEARKRVLLQAQVAPIWEGLGINRSAISTRLRSWANYSVQATELQRSINSDKPLVSHWTGIQNQSSLSQATVNPADVEAFVKKIDATQDWHATEDPKTVRRAQELRQYITRVFLGFDTRIDFSDLSFDIDEHMQPRGRYTPKDTLITLRAGGANTMAHEFGHYLDDKWMREAGGRPGENASERGLMLAQVEERTSQERSQWMERFSEFVLDIGMRSDIGSDYTQRRAEVFARFADQFIRWTESQAGVPSYGESFYADQFTRGDFLRFVDLLQEKAFVDAKDGNPFGSRQQARPRPDGISEALYEEEHRRVPTFYSALRQVVAAKVPTRASASQVQDIIRKGAVKKDELAWTGVVEWLKGQDTVTKAALLDYLDKHQLELDEVELGPPVAWPKATWEGPIFRGATQFGHRDLQLPGGAQYREFLIRMPRPHLPADATVAERQAYNEVIAKAGPVFEGGHFEGYPNVVAHVRFKTRTGPNGEKVLAIEEVQSDWHQQGREFGYAVKDDPKLLAAITRKRTRVAELNNALAEARALRQKAEAVSASASIQVRMKPLIEAQRRAERNEHNIRTQLGLADAELRSLDLEGGEGGGFVPDAPFKTSWPELAMKRMLRYAADQGFDTIAWTTGQQQIGRYDLSKRIESVSWVDGDELRAHDHSGTEVINEVGVGSEDLDSYLGAELASRLRETPSGETPSGRDVHELTGQDLQVGGEGMKTFYDRMLPSVMKKFGKKWGATVEDVTIPGLPGQGEFEVHESHEGGWIVVGPEGITDEDGYDSWTIADEEATRLNSEAGPVTMHSMAITSDMRDSLLYTGQPLFEKERITMAQLRGIAKRLGTSVETQADRARKQGYDVPTLRPPPRPRQGVVPDADLPAAKAISKKRILAYPSLQKHDPSIRDDIADIMADAEGFQTQRRDVQSIERTKALAAAMELPTGPLRAGTAGTAEELYAYANAIEYTLGRYKELEAKGSQQTHEDTLEASRLWDQAIMLTQSYRGMKAETGRAMNILRSKHVLKESNDVLFIRHAINMPGFDKDLERIRQSLARAGDDPVKLLQELKDHSATWFDYLQAYAYQNMLSGLKTHLRNTIGNSANIGFNLALVPIAASPIEVYFAKKQGRAMEVYHEEAAIGVAAAWGHRLEGWRRAAFSFTHGYRQSEVDAQLEGFGGLDFKRVELMPEVTIKGKRYGIPPGRVYDWTKMAMNYASRGLVAGDEFFRTMADGAEKQAGMYAEVRKLGITEPAAIAQRTAEIWASTRGADFEIKKLVLRRAKEFAARMVFQEKPGKFVSHLLSIKNDPDWRVRWIGMAVAPFVRTPGAIMRQGLEWSPIGFTMREARKGTMWDPEGDLRQGAQARGRAAIGTLMSFPLMMLAAAGYLTGSPPDDPEEREEFYAAGKLPNAVFIPLSTAGLEGEGLWVRYVLFQPFSIAASAWASALQGLSIKAAKGEDINEEDIEGSILMGLAGAAASLLDQSFLSSVDTILSTLQSPERGWQRLLSNMMSPYVPNSGLLRNIVQATDPYFRRPKGMRQSLKALNPWQAQTLVPLITRHGEPATRTPDNFFWRGFVVPMVSRAQTDKLTTELARLGLRRTRSKGEFKAGGITFAKNDDQKALISMAVGYTRHVMLEDIIDRAGYDRWDDERKFETLQQAYTDASSRVRKRVVALRRKPWTLQNLMHRNEYRAIDDPTLGVRAWPQER